MGTSAFHSASGRAPVLPLQIPNPRVQLVLCPPHIAGAPGQGAALRHAFLALFFSSILPSLLPSSHSAHRGSLYELHSGGGLALSGGAACSPEPRQVPLKLLLLSLEVLDVFHLGTRSHQGGGEGCHHRDRAGRYIPVGPVPWAPQHAKGTRGLPSPSDWSCSSHLRVSRGTISLSAAQEAALGKRTQQVLVSWTLPAGGKPTRTESWGTQMPAGLRPSPGPLRSWGGGGHPPSISRSSGQRLSPSPHSDREATAGCVI